MRANRFLSLLLALAAAAPLAAQTLPAERAASPVPLRLPFAAETPARPGLLPNGSFAVDFELARLDSAGGSFRLSDHVGPVAAAVDGGPDAVIVAFMASWCGICHRSLPLLKKLKAEQGGRLLLVVISTDSSDEKARLEAKKIAEAGLDVPVMRGDADTLNAWLGKDRGVPRYFFLNRIGEVMVRDKGFGKNVAGAMPKQLRYTLSHPEYVER